MLYALTKPITHNRQNGTIDKMALREISQNSRETRNRILKRQTGLVNLAKKAETIINEDLSRERKGKVNLKFSTNLKQPVLCEINHPNVTTRRKPLKRSKCYDDLLNQSRRVESGNQLAMKLTRKRSNDCVNRLSMLSVSPC